jgi:hypothetical protein
VNAGGGRDHWPRVFSLLLAGGGVKRGHVYGASDALAAEPKKDPLSVEDYAHTLYHLLGIDARKDLMSPGNRPQQIVMNGKVVKGVAGVGGRTHPPRPPSLEGRGVNSGLASRVPDSRQGAGNVTTPGSRWDHSSRRTLPKGRGPGGRSPRDPPEVHRHGTRHDPHRARPHPARERPTRVRCPAGGRGRGAGSRAARHRVHARHHRGAAERPAGADAVRARRGLHQAGRERRERGHGDVEGRARLPARRVRVPAPHRRRGVRGAHVPRLAVPVASRPSRTTPASGRRRCRRTRASPAWSRRATWITSRSP